MCVGAAEQKQQVGAEKAQLVAGVVGGNPRFIGGVEGIGGALEAHTAALDRNLSEVVGGNRTKLDAAWDVAIRAMAALNGAKNDGLTQREASAVLLKVAFNVSDGLTLVDDYEREFGREEVQGQLALRQAAKLAELIGGRL